MRYGYALRGLGVLHRGQWDRYPEALADARRAHEMNPNDTFVLRILGMLEAAAGEPERGIEHLHQIMRLNPRDPRSHMTYHMLAFASFGAKQYAEGIDWASRALKDRPQMIQRTLSLVLCFVGAGEIDKAKSRVRGVAKACAPEYLREQAGGHVGLRSTGGSQAGDHFPAHRRRPRRPERRRGAAMTAEQRRLAAIVSADVAGYSRLMGRDESGTLAALKALRREVVDPRIAKHNGRIVKTTGDGLLLEFASVVDAVRCVIEVQTAMAEKTADVPEDRRIAFRIGVNIGDIIIDGDDIFGDGVNVAARLQEIAPPGGVCVSGRVHDDVRDRLDATFADDGRADTEEHRPAGPGLALVAGRRAGRVCRPPPVLAAARQAVDRRAAVPEHERRSRAGVFRRRHDRGHHHRAVALPEPVRDRPQLARSPTRAGRST